MKINTNRKLKKFRKVEETLRSGFLKKLKYFKNNKAKQTFANLTNNGCVCESLFCLYTS